MYRTAAAGQQIILNKPKTKRKKNPRNAFSFFLDDTVKDLRRAGHEISNKGEAVPLATEKWKNFSPEEKAVYEEKAKEWKIKNKQQTRSGRLDCTGQPIDFRVNMEDKIETERKQARKVFRGNWPPGQGVCDVHFYLISFQSLFELPQEEGYQPCEVAVLDYTLNGGIERVWHQFIDPGPIKLGMRAEIKMYAEKTHRIPEEGFERASAEYHVIWDELLNFVKRYNSANEIPPLFCKISEKLKTTFCLEWLSAHAGVGNRLGKVYEVEDMAAELFAHSGMMRPSLTSIEDGCNSHMYDYEANTTCDYHEEIECVHCALLTVKKCCYWMSDSLAKAYGFEITEHHLPVKKAPNFVITAPDTTRVEDFRSRRNRNDPRRGNPLSSLSNDHHEYVRRPDDRFRDPPGAYAGRDIRFRPTFDVVPTTTQCTTVVMTEEPTAMTFAQGLSSTSSLVESGDGIPRALLSGNQPSTALSRRPVSNPHFAPKQAGTLAANFRVKPKPVHATNSSFSGGGDIDSLSQDFDGSVSVSSSGVSEASAKPRIPKAMLGRGRGRGQFK